MKRSFKGKALATALSLSLLQVPLFGGLVHAANSVTSIAVASGEASSSTVGVLDESLAKISKDEAVEKFRKLFPEFKDAEAVSVQLGNPNQYPPSNEMIWTIEWSVAVDNGTHGFSTSIDAITGDILTYYYPIDQEYAYYPAKVTKDEAEKIAKQFITVAAPSIKTDKLELLPTESNYPQALFGQVQYTFIYQMQVNGIPTSNSQIQVTVDGNGKINNYFGSSTNKNYPSPDTTLTAAEAGEKMKKNIKLQLAYIPNSDYYNSPLKASDYRLGYISTSGTGLIDANSGKYLDENGQAVDSLPEAGYSAISSTAAPFQPHKGEELTKEEAVAVVATASGRKLSEEQGSISSNRNGHKVWNISSGDPFGGEQIHAEVDAATGRLIQFFTYSYSSDGSSGDEAEKAAQSSITESEAKAKAQDLVTKLYPNASGDLKLIERPGNFSYGPDIAYTYLFQQFYKDKPIQPSTVQINLDGKGNLQQYYSTTTPVDTLGKLDSLTAKVTEEEALKVYRDALSAELQYVTIGGNYVAGKLQEQQVKLVYSPVIKDFENNISIFVNAISGKLEQQYNFLGMPEEKGELPADAKKHWASKSLEIMFNYGVIKPESDGLIHPDQTVNTGDWVNILLASFGAGQYYNTPEKQRFADIPLDSEYANAVDYLVQRGFLQASPTQKLHPEQALTRGNLAVWLTKLLKYEKLSEFMANDTDVTKLKDAGQIKNKGAATIAIKLGLLTTDNGKFNPDAPVTKAQISTVLLRLATLQNKVDSPIMNNYY
ncbi:S-layer-like y domain-containing protein [Paenibacillus lupini]|uniref:S-layer homology domain-containing protein n=1 Tax=Paenibacillus lupini TaxID=1450204 RepID=UPI001423B8F7|nr:S-layer homology domain-containing protein [Paenibacillus lupini]NIK24126.1 Zn-dependent metalloprotease [Paenibacillus lupini]